MDSSSYKLYHVHGFDSRQALDHYFSDKADMVFEEDSLKFPIENLTKTFTEGHIKGDVLIDLTAAPLIHHLLSACEFFRHIIVLKVQDRCILELKRWLDTRTGAFDWGHATKLHLEKENKSDQSQNKEGKVRSIVQHVMKCDVKKENMTDPIVLPPADCIIIGWLLDQISKDQDEYIRYLRKFSGMLKPGGHIILLGLLDVTYIKVGKDKIHSLKYDENFARKAVVEAGFVIDNCVTKKRTNVIDLTDYKAIIFIAAHKEK
ncbi:indolethylamine N-methyltransferase-like [Hyla sarda]|uniref:indolethylamine N-methyltransferase-like n=1 Tax=Hyla sarda TaxID=327740 RepID=UPI0024C43938|nr:indolethylamine N-methyltransferase-like [Hyla sarda]